jgi:hypothetical protein
MRDRAILSWKLRSAVGARVTTSADDCVLGGKNRGCWSGLGIDPGLRSNAALCRTLRRQLTFNGPRRLASKIMVELTN